MLPSCQTACRHHTGKHFSPVLLTLVAILLTTGCQTAGLDTAAAENSLAPPAAAAVFGEAVRVTGHPDPLSLLDHGDPELARNKRLVFDFWRSIVNAGQVELADTMQQEHYIQHSPVLPTGREAFKQIFSVVPRLDPIPELVSPPLVSIIAEGDLVAMTLVETLPEPDGIGTYTTTHYNLFRIEDGRLAEHWHSVQTPPGPEVLLPEDGGPQLVTGASGEDQYALLEAEDPELETNKRLVFDLWRQVIDAGHEELADIYLSEDYIQHNPNAASGLDGVIYFFTQVMGVEANMDCDELTTEIVAVMAEDDYVTVLWPRTYDHPNKPGETYSTSWFDTWRFVDGKADEHWDPAMITPQ